MDRITDTPIQTAPLPEGRDEDGQPPRSAGARPAGSARSVISVLALVFFMAPALLYIGGSHGQVLNGEHRASTPRPSQGWAFFDNATNYVRQRLPLRNDAVSANDWLSRNIFGNPPLLAVNVTGPDKALPFGGVNVANGGYNQTGGAAANHPVVATGRDGWLFLQGELDTTCKPPVAFATAVQRWNSFVQTIRASGRNVVLLVAPEKSTIYPEYVLPGTISWPCAEYQKARLWSMIEGLRNPDILPLRQQLLALKRQDPKRLLYLPLDSHWNDLGGLVLARDALAHVGGGVRIAPGDVHISSTSYTGDIEGLTPDKQVGVKPVVTIRRPGDDAVTPVQALYGGAITTHARGPGWVIPGTTLFLHDSYGDSPAPMLTHYAARMINTEWVLNTPQGIVKWIRQSNTVIIETVERDFLNRSAIGLQQTVLTPHFLQTLAAAIGRPPS